MENYERMIIPTLKNIAREKGLRGYSRLKKSELIRKLREPIPPRDLTRTQLIQLARETGLTRYHSLRKAELIQRLGQHGSTILDRGIGARMANVPILTPTPYTPPPRPTLYTPPPRPTLRPTPSSKAVKDLLDYLGNVKEIPKSVSPKLNKLQEQIKKIFEEKIPFEVKDSDSALRSFAKVYTVDAMGVFDPRSFMDGARENLTEILRNNRNTKVKLILKIFMIHEKENITKEFAFHSNIEVNLEGTDEDHIYIIMMDKILEKIERFINGDGNGGTGWAVFNVIKLELHTVSYKPLRGGIWLPLPEELKVRKAIINMKNEDNKCFLWSVLRALNPKDNHPERVDKDLKSKENTLNMEGIEYPVSLKDIDKFEKQNPSISIIVYGYKNKKETDVYPLRISKNIDRKHIIRLMLIVKNGVKHYTWVKNQSALLASQVSNHKERSYFCDRCLNPFWCEKPLNNHLEYCSNHKAVKIVMPGEGTILKFKDYQRSERVPFKIFADFESLTKKIQTCEANPEKCYTKKYQKHEIISFSYYNKCFDDMVYEPVMRSYTGPDASKIFVEWLEKDIKIIANIPKKNMIFGKEEAERFNETECWMCKEEFKEDDKNKKVKDHCHFTGRYRGAAHNKCNLKYSIPKFTPVLFHNLAGYDSHLFIKELGFSEGNIDCIPNNEEKYISFTKTIQVGSYTNKKGEIKPLHHKIRFIDSFKFMADRLDKLVKNLPKEAFNSVKREFKRKNLELLTRKGVYPYDYMDTPEKLKEIKLPPKEAFYSKLNNKGISDEDYKHAQRVWEAFEMN